MLHRALYASARPLSGKSAHFSWRRRGLAFFLQLQRTIAAAQSSATSRATICENFTQNDRRLLMQRAQNETCGAHRKRGVSGVDPPERARPVGEGVIRNDPRRGDEGADKRAPAQPL